MRELNNSMMYLREFSRRADCRSTPIVTIEFSEPGDLARFTAQLMHETLPSDLDTRATRHDQGVFKVGGVVICTGVRGRG